MQKKSRFIIGFLVLVVFVLVAATFAKGDINFFEWGKSQTEIDKAENSIIATVNGVPIYQSSLDTYKVGLKFTGQRLTDQEVLDALIRQVAAVQGIEKLGYSVSDAAVNAFNDERFAAIEDNPEMYKVLKDYLDGRGISLEEYKAMSKETSYKSLLFIQYNKELKREFLDNSSLATTPTDFKRYFDEKLNRFYEAAEVEIID